MPAAAPSWATSSIPLFTGQPSPSDPVLQPSSTMPQSPDNHLPCTLEELRELAEDFAHIEYAQRPGRNATMAWTEDMEENKKRKKKKSAYITRFRQKHYENLLERRVAVSEMEMRVGCEVKRELMGVNGQLREQLKMLEKMVGSNSTGFGNALQENVQKGGADVCMDAGTSTENVVASVVAEEEAADLASTVVEDVAFGVEQHTNEPMDNSWVESLTTTNDETDAETQTSDGSASLATMQNATDNVENVFADCNYTKPNYDDFMMDDNNMPFIGQDVSSLLAKLTKAA